MDMRISGAYGAYNAYATKKTIPASRVRGGASTADSVSFSVAAGDLNIAHRAVNELPDIRAAHVSRLAEQIQNGTYQISGERVAARIFGAAE